MLRDEFVENTWAEVRELGDGVVVILPTGAVEAHGPHLPLSTDVVIAEAMARSGAAMLRAVGVSAVVLPALHYTAAGFGAAFPGTVSLSPAAVTETVVGIARAVAAIDGAALAIANSHLDPAHLGSLHDAAAAADREKLPPVVFPDLTCKPWALRLGDEFASGACHAGRYETSIVMAERPDLVRDDVRVALPPNSASLSTAIRDGKSTFEEAGGPDAYFGSPADASAEEGRETVEKLGAILAEAVREAVASRP